MLSNRFSGIVFVIFTRYTSLHFLVWFYFLVRPHTPLIANAFFSTPFNVLPLPMSSVRVTCAIAVVRCGPLHLYFALSVCKKAVCLPYSCNGLSVVFSCKWKCSSCSRELMQTYFWWGSSSPAWWWQCGSWMEAWMGMAVWMDKAYLKITMFPGWYWVL